MDNIKKNAPEGALNEEELNNASGGVSRADRYAPCKRCGKQFRELSLVGGLCQNCLEELHKMGGHPLI